MGHPSSSDHPYIERVLVLSLEHIPRREPAFGTVKAVPFERGFVVFVPADGSVIHWLKPIIAIARRDDCTLVLFDAAGSTDPELPTFDW